MAANPVAPPQTTQTNQERRHPCLRKRNTELASSRVTARAVTKTGATASGVASTLQNPNTVEYALAIHNPRDVFSKPRGKETAITRLSWADPKDGHVSRFRRIVLVHSPRDAKLAIMQELAADSHLPRRVRDAAKLWLDSDKKRRDDLMALYRIPVAEPSHLGATESSTPVHNPEPPDEPEPLGDVEGDVFTTPIEQAAIIEARDEDSELLNRLWNPPTSH